jgi:hypothetical protein
MTIARDAGMSVHFQQINIRGAHPNTVRMTVTGASGRMLVVEAASVGGGNIEVHKIDGLGVNFTGGDGGRIDQSFTGGIAPFDGAITARVGEILIQSKANRSLGAGRKHHILH